MEGKISDIKERNLEMTQREEEQDLRVKSRLKELCENYYLTPSESSAGARGTPEEERERGRRACSIVDDNFPSHGESEILEPEKQTEHPLPQCQKTSPKHIVLKLSKLTNRERILTAAREKTTVTCKGKPTRSSPDFSAETRKATRVEPDVQTRRERNYPPQLIHPDCCLCL